MYFKSFLLSEIILVTVPFLCTVASAYQVALVEYLCDDQVFPSLLPIDLGNRNAKIYNDIVGSIADLHGNVDLVVFPEGTLVSEPLDTAEGRKGMTSVPSPIENVIPCNSSSDTFSSYFKLLSCTAAKHRTYLVINLKEKENCQGKKCSSSGLNFYNTDVVFDRYGKVIARYRKYNLYLEPDTNRTSKPELVTFDTDFGRTFGIFTCFDILFEAPAIELVRKGIKNFIFPTLWIPELPFLSTVQVQQMWAQGNDVNLLTAGAAYPTVGSGGVGIFLGHHGVLGKNVSPRTDNYVLFKDVPDDTQFKPVCSTEVDDKIARVMDNYSTYQEDLSEYSYKKLDIDSLSTVEESLCQQNGQTPFCCKFKVELGVNKELNNTGNSYTYFFVVRSGFRNYGNNTYRNYIEVCALVACAGTSIKNCGKRFSNYNNISWPITFTNIDVSTELPNTERTKQFPNSLLADFSPVSPTCTTWKIETREDSVKIQRFASNVSLRKLLTFAIFGRDYAKDK